MNWLTVENEAFSRMCEFRVSNGMVVMGGVATMVLFAACVFAEWVSR